ncbi:DUF4215 domain-containing protein [Sorangium sp. So ce134]
MSFHISARPRPLAAAASLLLFCACDMSVLEGLDTAEQGANTGSCASSMDCPDEGDPDEGYLGAGGAPPEEVCGNGVVQRPAEQCDDGNTDDDDGCTSACTLTEVSVDAVCGDGVVQTPVEQCDDANADDDDGCANDCVFSTVAFEYSGVVVSVEQSGSVDPLGPRDTGVHVGDTFSGIYTFDPHMHDFDGHPASSLYEFYNAPGFFGHQAQVGPLTVTSAPHAPEQLSAGPLTTIALTDGTPGYGDSYTVNCSLNEVAGFPSSWDVDLIYPTWILSLSSLSDPSAISSTALPDTPPDLATFEEARVVLVLPYQATPSSLQSWIYITAELTSLTRVAGD